MFGLDQPSSRKAGGVAVLCASGRRLVLRDIIRASGPGLCQSTFERSCPGFETGQKEAEASVVFYPKPFTQPDGSLARTILASA